MDNTFARERRARLVAILGDKSSPREQRIDRLARFVEDELRRAYIRGVRGKRAGKPVSSRVVREDVEVEQVGEDEL